MARILKILSPIFAVLALCCLLLAQWSPALAQMAPSPAAVTSSDRDFVAVIDMSMPILPGTSDFLKQSIEQANRDGARLLIVRLDTPGGMLHSAQEMIQSLLNAPIPVVIYVSPSGSSAISAGVFITLAGHVAAMAPGTSIGAAHPVQASGADLDGDMRNKVESITVAIVKSIAEHRGRNVAWAEKSVKESSSLTEQEALKMGVIDLVADDIDDLLKQIKGKEVKVSDGKIALSDYSSLPRRKLNMSVKQKALNVFADPNIVALLWLGATTGLAIELYNPGVILPGVVGIICLILALAVSQVIPVTQSGILLLIVGTLLIGAEIFVPSGVLGIGGIIAIILGAIYLVDVSIAPDLAVDVYYLVPFAAMMGMLLMGIVTMVVRSSRRRVTTGSEGLVGQVGTVVESYPGRLRIFVNGETWNAELIGSYPVEKDEQVIVVAKKEGLLLEVKPLPDRK
jgi:membrane-bound serine protease (ClpP class)